MSLDSLGISAFIEVLIFVPILIIVYARRRGSIRMVLALKHSDNNDEKN